jgi:predicted sugar kinase
MWGLIARPIISFLVRRLTVRQAVSSTATTAYGMTPHSQQEKEAREAREQRRQSRRIRDRVQISSEARRCERPTQSIPNFGAWNLS